MPVLQKLQRRKSFLGFLAIGAVGLASLAAIGGRTGDYAATVEAASPSALERKVDNLQKNLKTMQTKLNRSVARVAELEMMLDGVLLGEIPVADADTLDGLDSTEFVLASEELGERVTALEIAVDEMISGVQPVGDASKLDGRSASEYLLASAIDSRLHSIENDLDSLDALYLRKSGGTVGPLTVEGNLTVTQHIGAGRVRIGGAATGDPTAAGTIERVNRDLIFYRGQGPEFFLFEDQ